MHIDSKTQSSVLDALRIDKVFSNIYEKLFKNRYMLLSLHYVSSYSYKLFQNFCKSGELTSILNFVSLYWPENVDVTSKRNF